MRIPDSYLDAVRRDGFASMEGFLTADELDAARNAMFGIVPQPGDYFADPDRYERLVRHQFSGLRVGPLDAWDLDRLAFHPDLVDAAERYCGASDLQLYKIELWAKYSGAVDYDQTHHRDYGNHSLVVPRADGRWPQLTSFILLSDVTVDDGPTKVVPRSVGDRRPMVPLHLDEGELRDEEVAVTGPAGTIFSYTTDVLHRGSAMTGHPRSRFALLSDFSERGNPWMGKVSWPERANASGFRTLIERATVRERDLFGFPPPGHEYWNEQTLADVALRYPGLDLDPYRSPM